MTTEQLLERHHEGHHRCVVEGGRAPDLRATCIRCRARLEADLLSACFGGRQDSRLILMLLCPACGSTGQLRFAKTAPWNTPPPTLPTDDGSVEVLAGGAGYVQLSCSCGGAGTVHVLGHRVSGATLLLDGVVEGCGHAVAVRFPCTARFSSKGHRHG